jgi:hypothetical protein
MNDHEREQVEWWHYLVSSRMERLERSDGAPAPWWVRELLMWLDDGMKRLLADDGYESQRRHLLRQRINRMIAKLVQAGLAADARSVHVQWMAEGGKGHGYMTAEELRRKVDWLYRTWPQCFPRDTRDWTPSQTSPDAPMLSRQRRQPLEGDGYMAGDKGIEGDGGDEDIADASASAD